MNDLDNHFKKHLEGLKISPSANLWKDKIAPRLADAPAKGYAAWYRAAAVILLFLGSWFAVSHFGNTQNDNQPEMPIATQPTQTAPPETVDKTLNSVQHAPIHAESAPTFVGAERDGVSSHKSTKQTAQKIAVTERSAVPVAQELEAYMLPVVAENRVKVKISIGNFDKYVVPATPENEPAKAKADEVVHNSIKDYALAQFKNLAKREKLEAPPKEWFEFPQLAVRVEGNPLKKVLLPN